MDNHRALRPAIVDRGVNLLWLTLAITALGVLANRLTGAIKVGDFAAMLIFYAICAIFPYKIGRGSNATRMVYLVLMIGSILFAIGTRFATHTKIDVFLSIILFPVEIYAMFCLFSKESNDWFEGRSPQSRQEPL